MAYQLGVNGLLGFKKTLRYMSQKDWEKASVEMLDSRWAKQTQKRAEELSAKIKSIDKEV
jgi:lysozyme